MIIYLRGEDAFRAKLAFDQLKERYQAKNPNGVELIEINEETESPSWVDLHAVPLFATARFVVIRRAGLFPKSWQQELADALKHTPKTTVVALWDGKELPKGSDLGEVLKKADKALDVSRPTGEQLKRWIAQRAKALEVSIDSSTIDVLSESPELWSIEMQLQVLASGGQLAESGSVNRGEPFAVFNLVRRGKWEEVGKQLYRQYRAGDPIELLIGTLASAIRKEVNDKATAAQLVSVLSDIDLGLKVGILDPEAALALLSAHLPKPLPNRVQWERVWEEIY